MTKPTDIVRPAKTQITLGIRPVRLESLLCAHGVAKDTIFLHADSEDSDQTSMGAQVILLVLSCCGSFVVALKYTVRDSLNRYCFITILLLTHICLVDPSILINWTSPFPMLGVSHVLFHFYSRGV